MLGSECFLESTLALCKEQKMQNRKTLLILTVIVLGLLVFFAMQAGGSKMMAQSATKGATSSSTNSAAPNATMAGTEVDMTALCEALRTVKQTPATVAPGGTPSAAVEIARPSNAGGPGPAIKLIGDPKAGQKIYTDNCQKCHGDQGAGGIANPGSDDGTIPSLNPIDDTFVDVDPVVFACNADLFVEHGSVPSGPSPKETMQPWGDNKILTPQQIADVISYVLTLNGAMPATAVPTKAK
jgi:hypothetical protein